MKCCHEQSKDLTKNVKAENKRKKEEETPRDCAAK